MNNEQERCRAIRWLLNANREAPLKTSLYFIVFEEKTEECTFLLYKNYLIKYLMDCYMITILINLKRFTKMIFQEAVV